MTNHGPRCWCHRCNLDRLANGLAELQAGTTPERAAQIAAQAEEIADRSPNRLAVNEDVSVPDEPLMTGREMDRRAGWHYPEGA